MDARAVAEETDPTQQRAVGDSRGDKKNFVARGEVALRVDAVEIGDTHGRQPFGLTVSGRDKPALHAAVQAAHGGGGKYAFRGAAGSHHSVDIGAAHGGRDAGRKIAVADQADPGPGPADVLDQLLMARAVENDDDHFVDRPVERTGDGFEVLRDGGVEVDEPARLRPDNDFLHVAIGRAQQAAAVGGREHGDRPRRAGGAEVGAFERINRDIHKGCVVAALANFLAGIKQWRFVPLSLADHDLAIHRDQIHLGPHGFDRDMVGVSPFALAHGSGGSDGGALGNAEEIPGKFILDHIELHRQQWGRPQARHPESEHASGHAVVVRVPQRPSPRLRKCRVRGLDVVHERASGPLVAVALSLRAGARFDGRHPGLAHLTEHMLFQGTGTLSTFELNRRAAEVGIGHNASTDHETIEISLECLPEDLEGALELLLAQVRDSVIEAGSFAKEKRVVLDEIRSLREDPLERLSERAWAACYSAPVGRPVCGTPGSLAKITVKNVRAFLDRYLQPGNAVLGLVGDVPPARVEKILNSLLGRGPAGARARGEGTQRLRPPPRGVRLRPRDGGRSFIVRLHDIDSSPRQLLALEMALDVVGTDPDGHLFQTLRERHGLGYELSSSVEWGMGWGALLVSASAGPGRARRLEEILERELQASVLALVPAEIERARHKRTLSHAALESARLTRALAHADAHLLGYPTLAERRALVKSIRPPEIVAAWQKALAARRVVATLDG